MPEINIRIPQPLRRHTEGKSDVIVSGGTVGSILKNLDTKFPGIGERIFDDDGQVRKHIVVYVNNEDIRYLQKLDSTINDGDEVIIHPAIAGGIHLK